MSEQLPELLDAKRLQDELGVTRAAAEAIMRQLPVIQFDGLRKVYVRRADVARLIETRTFGKERCRRDRIDSAVTILRSVSSMTEGRHAAGE